MKALDLAKWFLDANPALRDGHYDSCMKLNRLLFLTNLMHYALRDKKLIDDKFERWDYGPVIRELYTAYRHNNLFKEAPTEIAFEDAFALKIAKVVNFVFGHRDSLELSDECRDFFIWKNAERNGEIQFKHTDSDATQYMKNIYSTYKDENMDDLVSEVIGGNKYAYDKKNMTLTDDIALTLEKMPEQSDSVFLLMINGELVFS